VPSNAVSSFVPSRNGFHFANFWPAGPAFSWHLGLVHLGLGDTSRGLCGGMVFAARDRFERAEAPPPDRVAPAVDAPLFREIARRQLDSFDRLVVVPLRFWWMSARPAAARLRASIEGEWPAIRREIDEGHLAMIGLVRDAGLNPLRLGVGHQVLGFRYDETATQVVIGVYDPNHPDDDDVELRFERDPRRAIVLSQSTGEPLLGVLHLPYIAPSPQR
jgi:hypothetical protein